MIGKEAMEKVEENLENTSKILSSAEIIYNDMSSNRMEYSTKDLSWRMLDLTVPILKSVLSLQESLELVVKGLKEREEMIRAKKSSSKKSSEE